MAKFIVGSIGTILSVLIILFGSSLLEGIILWVSYQCYDNGIIEFNNWNY